MGDFKRLKVWQAAHAFALDAYRATAGFPPDERFGMTAQIRRAAVSVAANIAESCGRAGDADQCRFLRIAKGSAKELRSHLLIARDLGFPSPAQQMHADAKLEEIERMLSSMIRNSSGFRLPSSGLQ